MLTLRPLLASILSLSLLLIGGNAYAQDLAVDRNPAVQDRIPLASENREATAQALQATLVELIDLTLVSKQAHWNVSGPLFYSLHTLLDHFVEDYRADLDRVAERKLAIGRPADGRPDVVSTNAELPSLPEGYLADFQVLDLLSQRLNTVCDRLRDRINTLDELDLVSQDILIDVERHLAEHLWMLRALQAQPAPSITPLSEQ